MYTIDPMTETHNALIRAKKLELHYWFSDKTYTMDALVYNKCERELLEITKAISSLCGISIKLETEPSARGGLKSWLTIHARSEKKTPPIKITLVATLVAAAMVTPVNGSIATAAEKLLAVFLKDRELSEDEQKLSSLEIGQLKEALNDKLAILDQSLVIKKRRSNFYEQLKRYQKVKAVSIAVEDASRKNISEEQFAARESFASFIIVSGQLEPVVHENVSIEIISPVLGQGNFKWKGKYQGAPISFSMKSEEFMALVQSGKVEFKNGTTIGCTLQIEKRMNSEGVERITGYNILHVASYFENGKAVETTEGKQHRQKQNAGKRQLDLFG
jgi:hypothetical protein